ncbi:hypothetical protein H5P36_11065 [Bacillus sp. APMAM]|nr:hypothetical protein [Bacillus sp. APMAM]RTZ55906.1 hypothetical protein EKO25_10555 [Bacillus sp. SAJ1]
MKKFIRGNKARIILVLIIACIFWFIWWVNSPEKIDFADNIDNETHQLMDESNVLKTNQISYFSFDQMEETEHYKVAIFRGKDKSIYDSFDLNLNEILQKAPAVYFGFFTPIDEGEYTMRIQDDWDDIVAEGDFKIVK